MVNGRSEGDGAGGEDEIEGWRMEDGGRGDRAGERKAGKEW